MKNYLKSLINPSLGIITLIYILFFAIGVATYFVYSSPMNASGTLPKLYDTVFMDNQFTFFLISLTFVFLTSVLITQTINKYSFIRTRSFLPTFIYLCLIVAWLPTHADATAFAAALLILVAVHITLGLYKMKNAVEPAFLLSFLLAIATILIPEYAPLIIFFWIGFFFLKCFSGRIFFATLLGFITPFILIGSVLYYILQESTLEFLTSFLINRIHIIEYSSLYELIYPTILGLILVISLFQMFSHSNKENIQTRNELNFLKTIGLGILLLLIFLNNNNIAFLPIAAGFYALLTSYSFTLKTSKFNNILFSLFTVANLIVLIYFIII